MDLPNVDPDDSREGVQNLDNRAQMRHQLVLLLHAHKCLRRYHEVECTLQHCATMKRILIHLESCRDCTKNAGKCTITGDNCQFCLPLKMSRIKEWQQSITIAQRGHLVDLLLENPSIWMSVSLSRFENKIYDEADSLEDYYRVMAANLRRNDNLAQT